MNERVDHGSQLFFYPLYSTPFPPLHFTTKLILEFSNLSLQKSGRRPKYQIEVKIN